AGVTVVAIAVVVALAWIVLRPNLEAKPNDTATVPTVAGMSYHDAAEALTAENIHWVRGGDEYSDSVASGDVIRTEPDAGTEVSLKGDEVTIVVSKGEKLVTVPKLVDRSREKAEA